MKLILNVEPLRHPMTGIGRYTRELARSLIETARLEDLIFWSNASGSRVLPRQPTEPARFGGIRETILSRFRRSRTTTRVMLAARQALAAASLDGFSGYLYHGPNYYLPRVPGPGVATFHDLSVAAVPDCHPPGRVAAVLRAMDQAVRRSAAIITISEFSKREILRFFSLPEERVWVTPLAADARFRPMAVHEITAALGTHGLEFKGYCLHVGSIEPRKNIDTLLDMYETLPPALRRRYPLVLVGGPGWRSAPLHVRIRRLERKGFVRYLGYVDDALLPGLTAGAALSLFPSVYEGFGLPLLEAMQSGTPVVASDCTSLPEVAGGCGTLVPTLDVDAWREAVCRGLEDAAWRSAAAASGLRRAARFSWSRCAEATLAVYRHVAKGAGLSA